MQLKKFTGLTLAISLSVAQSVSSEDSYQVVDLGKITGESYAMSVNNADTIVGLARGVFEHPADDNDTKLPVIRAFYFQTDMQEFEPDFKGTNAAVSLNGNGDATGYRQEFKAVDRVDSDGNPITTYEWQSEQAAFFVPGGVVEPVPLQADYLSMRGFDLNDSKVMAGRGVKVVEKNDDGTTKSKATWGFVYNASDDKLYDVSPLNKDVSTSAEAAVTAINNNNKFVGTSTFKVDGEEVTSVTGIVGTLLSSDDKVTYSKINGLGGYFSQLVAINDNDIAVGRANFEENKGEYSAMRYDVAANTATSLGYLVDRFKESDALAINNNNEVVGVSRMTDTPRTFHAFLYKNNKMTDLNAMIDCDSGWELVEARGINDNGTIVGTGTLKIKQDDGSVLGEVRAYKLIPRPGVAAKNDCKTKEVSDEGGGSLWMSSLLLCFLLRRRTRSARI